MRNSYHIEFTSHAARQFRKIPKSIQLQLTPHIDSLKHNPNPPGIKKLQGTDHGYRIRVGDYRILFEREDDRLVILVVQIVHRSKAYR